MVMLFFDILNFKHKRFELAIKKWLDLLTIGHKNKAIPLMVGIFLSIGMQTFVYAQDVNDTLLMFRNVTNETTWAGTNVTNAINESDEIADDIASGILPK